MHPPRRGWLLAAAATCSLAGALLVALGSRLAFFNDDWYFLLQRPGLGAGSLLEPHNGNLVVLAVLVFKSSVGIFGLGTTVPLRVVLGLEVAALGMAVFMLVRSRVGEPLGLLACLLIVLLGPAWEDLLWSFQLGLIGSLACGMWVLWLLEADVPRRNRLACLLLVAAIGLSNVGVPFIVAAGVAVALRRRPRQLWIALVPAALFGLWYLGYGSHAPSYITSENLRHLPRYVIDAAGQSLAALVGLKRSSDAEGRGLALVGIAAASLAVLVWRRGRPRKTLLVPTAAAATFWALTGAAYIPGREASASRYLLVGAALMAVAGAELLRGLRLPRALLAVLVVAGAGALASNLDRLHYGYSFMRVQAQYAAVDLGALELARAAVRPDFQLFEPIAHTPYLTGVTAARYNSETKKHGRPTFDSPAALARRPLDQAQAADSVLVAAYRMLPSPVTTTPRSCRSAATDEALLPGATALSVRSGGLVNLTLRRFASSGHGMAIGQIQPGATRGLVIPQDRLSLRWHLSYTGSGRLLLCRR